MVRLWVDEVLYGADRDNKTADVQIDDHDAAICISAVMCGATGTTPGCSTSTA